MVRLILVTQSARFPRCGSGLSHSDEEQTAEASQVVHFHHSEFDLSHSGEKKMEPSHSLRLPHSESGWSPSGDEQTIVAPQAVNFPCSESHSRSTWHWASARCWL
ncbi:hypothetical protein MRX96_044183 [Rhipicephalus microplus]